MTDESPIAISLDPEAINQYVARQIAESAIGDALKGEIDKAVKNLSQSYNSPFQNIVAQHINTEIQALIKDEYAERIREIVRERVTEEFTDELLSKMFATWVERFSR